MTAAKYSNLDILLKSFVSEPRAMDDPFFEEGNKVIPGLKKYGIFELDDENFLHEPVQNFNCNVYGCQKVFDTVFQFEQHYNCCHRYTCIECRKVFSTPHLLDLHVSETHDSFFAVKAEKSPMFQCYMEDCKELFLTPQVRKSHCLEKHNFLPGFWSDKSAKKVEEKRKNRPNQNKVKIEKSKKKERMQVEPDISGGPQETMEVDLLKEKEKKQVKSLGSAGHGRQRLIFSKFVKDISDSLPDVT